MLVWWQKSEWLVHFDLSWLVLIRPVTAEVHFDERGAAVRTGVGHGAMTEVFDQILQFRPGQEIVRLDGMAANRFGNGGFAQAQSVDSLPGGGRGGLETGFQAGAALPEKRNQRSH